MAKAHVDIDWKQITDVEFGLWKKVVLDEILLDALYVDDCSFSGPRKSVEEEFSKIAKDSDFKPTSFTEETLKAQIFGLKYLRLENLFLTEILIKIC